MTVRDSYPINLISECIDRMGDEIHIFILACDSCYKKIPLEEFYGDTTIMVCHYES